MKASGGKKRGEWDSKDGLKQKYLTIYRKEMSAGNLSRVEDAVFDD